MYGFRGRGMGDLPTDSKTGQYYVPSYCAFLPFLSSCIPTKGQATDAICQLPGSSLLSQCQPETAAQQVAGNIGAAASAQSQAELETQYAAIDQASCAADPTGCQAYKAAIANPTCSALFGTAFCGSIFGTGDGSQPGPLTNIPWWAWAIGGGIFLVAAFGGRR